MRPSDVIQIFPNFLTKVGIQQIRQEIATVLANHGKRRDLELNGTLRKMMTVGQVALQTNASITSTLMLSNELRRFVSGVIGIPAHAYPDDNEGCVVMSLQKPGDHQGIHQDDGLFDVHVGLLIETPKENDRGGKLVFSIGRNTERGPLYQEVPLQAGDLYVMRGTDTIPHGTLPLTEEGSRRTIIGLGLRTEIMQNTTVSPSSKLLFHS
ncbi:MAG: hypothetical protein KBD00_05650 [Candidatus Peribacteraceae bacterium]|nr:hypothetical protein [Candidatus Peribacteraceae bacterium]